MLQSLRHSDVSGKEKDGGDSDGMLWRVIGVFEKVVTCCATFSAVDLDYTTTTLTQIKLKLIYCGPDRQL